MFPTARAFGYVPPCHGTSGLRSMSWKARFEAPTATKTEEAMPDSMPRLTPICTAYRANATRRPCDSSPSMTRLEPYHTIDMAAPKPANVTNPVKHDTANCFLTPRAYVDSSLRGGSHQQPPGVRPSGSPTARTYLAISNSSAAKERTVRMLEMDSCAVSEARLRASEYCVASLFTTLLYTTAPEITRGTTTSARHVNFQDE
mmetsp:Transcript_15261/g.41813  ORF Transcript_15261/g.41813 Transcript_15261/m.41813 type:complete len:202 (+) Transcript_15261:959-1564(+)